jgi:fatty acid desaturase
VTPVAIALIAGGLHATLRGDRWDPRSVEARTLLDDEWRRQAMTRALRGAFGVVLAAQAPLALWLGGRPAPGNAVAMAIVTMTLGLATLCALFLAFDRASDDDAG